MPGSADDHVSGLIAQVAQARARVVIAVAGLGGGQESFTPGPQEWTLPEILGHLYLAEQVGVNRIWYAADAVRRNQPAWSGDLPQAGQLKVLRDAAGTSGAALVVMASPGRDAERSRRRAATRPQ